METDGFNQIARLIQENKKSEAIELLASEETEILNILNNLKEKSKEQKSIIEKLTKDGTYDFDNSIAWHIIEGTRDGPYCSLCLVSYQKKIPLEHNHNNNYQCKVCNAKYDNTGIKIQRRAGTARFY